MDTQASSFYGHVTLGLRIYFSYLSRPNVSKICSFINLCIHPSPFWAFGKIFIAFTLQAYTHIFSKTGYDQWTFQRKVASCLFQKHVGVLARHLFIIIIIIIFLLQFHAPPLSFFLSFFSSIEAPSPSFLSKALCWWQNSFFHGLFPSGWRLLSPLLLCLPLHLHGGKSPLKDLIETQRSSLHRSSTSKLPSSGIIAQELQVGAP